MKKALFTILLALIVPLTMAQHHPNPHSSFPEKKSTIIFAAENNELFWVTINGRNINKRAQNIVKIHNLPNRLCEVQIVLKSPVSGSVNLKITPQIDMERYVVSYNERTRKVQVTPMCESHDHSHPHPHHGPQPPTHVVPPVPPAVPHAHLVCSSEEVNEMCQSIRRESFDDNRMEMAKLMVKSNGKLFKVSHIKKMANCLTFDRSKLNFLKFAFTYCADPNNYYECVNVLTFSSDKKKLMQFLNSKLK